MDDILRMENNPEYFEQAFIAWNLEKLYLDLAKAKEAVTPHKKSGLTPTEKLHLKGLISGSSPAEIAKQLIVNPQGVNVALSNTVYRYVEQLTDHPLHSIENWREVAQWLDKAGYRANNAIDWGEAPNVDTFYGREQDLTQLKSWILKDRCRLIGLLGMGGIGKTALAVRLVEQVKDEFEFVVWRSLHQPTPFNSLVSSLFLEYSNQLPPLNSLSDLLQSLRNHRFLIVLDEIDTILKDKPVGHCQEEYKEFSELLSRIGTERHQSCLLITSRERPKEFVRLEDRKSSTHSHLLGSLQGAAMEILKEKELLEEEDQWLKLIQLYGGNPFALKIVSEIIRELFNRSVNHFFKQNTTFIDSEFHEILDQQFIRLSKPEKIIICQIAKYSHPISIENITEITSAQKINLSSIELIESLRRRSLLEKAKNLNNSQFLLHPIIAKYIKKYVISEIT